MNILEMSRQHLMSVRHIMEEDELRDEIEKEE